MSPITHLVVASILAAALGRAAPLSKHKTSDVVRHWVEKSGQSIEWGPCPDRFPDTLTCATFSVPLDWNKAGHKKGKSGETVQLTMSRIEATDKANRIGPLFVNPGGPGGSAVGAVARYARQGILDPEITAKFDVIGLDPRGVGLSTPVQCDVEAYNKRVKFAPKTEEEYDALVQYNRELGASCLAKTGPLLNYVDTISAAKDHEAVRIALGGRHASFLGLSYGTQLFSQYAALFPHSFRAMVLDGNLQRSQSESSNLLIEATTAEVTLKKFFEWCGSSDECVLRGQDVEKVFLAVREKATASPIPAPGCDDHTTCRSDLTDEDLLFTVQSFLISQRSWPAFAQGLSEADSNNATILSSANSFAIGSAYEDSYLFAGTAIACQDWAHGSSSSSLADVLEKERLATTFSPLIFGLTQSYRIQTSCVGWPTALTNPPAPVKYAGKVTLLQLNSLFDPSTSYVWALGLRDELVNTVLVTRNGSGHTSYSLGGGTTKIANTYLLNLTLPAEGTVTQT
ncbi:hypothetical protein F5Y17DRAFT_227138 [Xylariaceae sp. FL0594]|nr:hypothetical protein F5Y17DRAFT_227138 [Xylariaceae sp. FL0594]